MLFIQRQYGAEQSPGELPAGRIRHAVTIFAKAVLDLPTETLPAPVFLYKKLLSEW